MRRIVYYVATSLDGYISGPAGDISGFAHEGPGVDQYMKDLQSFDTVIMGKNTYEFGYAFGLKPGSLAYPHMEHHIFSNSLEFEEKDDNLYIHKLDINVIHEVKKKEGTDIYLCGGGVFAGWLLDNQLIDLVKIKLNPFVSGDGISMFGSSATKVDLSLQESQSYDGGLQIMTYKVDY